MGDKLTLKKSSSYGDFHHMSSAFLQFVTLFSDYSMVYCENFEFVSDFLCVCLLACLENIFLQIHPTTSFLRN